MYYGYIVCILTQKKGKRQILKNLVLIVNILNIMKHIAILDFGSQYTHLIARRIREQNVLSKIYPSRTKASKLPKDAIGIILSGGPQSVYDKNSEKIDKKIFKLKKPILGLCYGHQLMAKTLGGEVKPGKTKEYGKAELFIKSKKSILKNLPNKSTVWMSHGDSVIKIPNGFKVSAKTKDCKIAAFESLENKIFGLQFHPEVMHTEKGNLIIQNFVFEECKAKRNWKIKDIIKDIIRNIRKKSKNKNVFMLVSGGVDSSVAFSLISKALGQKRTIGLYIDTGFMRKNESKEIIANFKKTGIKNIKNVNAEKIFYKNLKKAISPEEKRKIIGKIFLEIKNNTAKKMGLNEKEWMLGQGTIYPDTIETGGTKNSVTIKTHHNRVDEIQNLAKQGKLIEPLEQFYKDEVRALGKIIKTPNAILKRHPFPGPGLAIRILCSRAKEKNTVVKKLPKNILKKIKNSGMNCSLVGIKSVGVQGDKRTYANPLALWGKWDYKKIESISTEITNSSKGLINRVMILINKEKNKKPVLLKSPKTKTLDKERIQLLQEIDNIVTKKIKKLKIYNKIWQFPVVLIPIGFKKYESVVLRPVVSTEAMTANFAILNKKIINSIASEIIKTKKIDYVFYDVTNKPPGTIEWE